MCRGESLVEGWPGLQEKCSRFSARKPGIPCCLCHSFLLGSFWASVFFSCIMGPILIESPGLEDAKQGLRKCPNVSPAQERSGHITGASELPHFKDKTNRLGDIAPDHRTVAPTATRSPKSQGDLLQTGRLGSTFLLCL